MSLEKILEAIRGLGDAQVAEIEERSRVKIREILANARIEAQQIEKDVRSATVLPALTERARIIQRARLEALKIVGEAREALVDSALEQIRGHLANIRNSPDYPAILSHLLKEALGEFDTALDEDCVSLEADPRDRPLLEKILHEELMVNLPVSYTLECWGGLIVRSQDGRVAVINTLEARLERATPHLRHYLAASFENLSRS